MEEEEIEAEQHLLLLEAIMSAPLLLLLLLLRLLNPHLAALVESILDKAGFVKALSLQSSINRTSNSLMHSSSSNNNNKVAEIAEDVAEETLIGEVEGVAEEVEEEEGVTLEQWMLVSAPALQVPQPSLSTTRPAKNQKRLPRA